MAQFRMPSASLKTVILPVALLATIAFAVKAQEGVGDPQTGHVLAKRVCSPCHAVEPDPHAPRMFDIGPDFETVANTPGMTATALNAFLLTSHPDARIRSRCPSNLLDVIAGILTLRGRPDRDKPR